MFFFYLFAALVVWLGIDSLRGGFRYLAYVRREMSREERVPFTPYASVIAPCRGMDQGLRENVAALFQQDYPSYEIIFVTDSAGDPALRVVEEVQKQFAAISAVASRTLIAGAATASGQKVHNLRFAVEHIRGSSVVLAFVDSDARVSSGWLRALIAPLADERVGAATGYRWFVPVRGRVASHLRSVWNASIASALGANADKNFCWGGSTAIRREMFEKLDMRAKWQGALSDDFSLMRVLREAGLGIHFVPDCLTASLEDCNWRELFEFTTRQLKITRVYASHFWKAVLAGSLLFVAVFFGGIALVLARWALGLSYVFPLILILLIFALGAGKAALRLRAVGLPLAPYRSELRRGALAHLTLWPFASALYLYNALCALFSRRINWRGLTYELKSPTETVIIAPARVESEAVGLGTKARRVQ